MNNPYPDASPAYIDPKANMQYQNQQYPYQNADNGASQDPLLYGNQPMKANFNDQIRLGFMRKVYSLVGMMLIVAFGMAIIPVYIDRVADFLYFSADITSWVILGVAFVVMIVSMCLTFCFKKPPVNYVLLGFFTVSMGYILMFCCGIFNSSVSGDSNSKWAVVAAIGATVSLTVIITVITLIFKEKVVLPALIGVSILVPLMWFLVMFFWLFNSMHMYALYCSLGVLVSSLVIVIDTYLVTNRLNVDEYIAASIIIFMDIIRLFLYLLMLFGRKK